MADNQQHIIPTAELIRQYLEGKLDGKTMHALEKQALDDPFLADALEGYVQYPADQQFALSDLQRRLQQRVAAEESSQKTGVVKRLDYRWVAAASVLVVLCITAVMFLNRSEKPQIAQVQMVDSVKTDTAVVEVAADEKRKDSIQMQAADAAAPAGNADALAFKKSDKPSASYKAAPALQETVVAKNADQPVLRLKEAEEEKRSEIAAARKFGGLEVKKSSKAPPIRIRGIGTIKDNPSALFVVDGVPKEGDVLETLEPKDIESITVMKDAAANAIYGARAANGVILINTKTGTYASAAKQAAAAPGFGQQMDSIFAASAKKSMPIVHADKIDTIHIGGVDRSFTLSGKLDSKVEGIVTGEKSTFSNYYTDDNVRKISGVVIDEQTGKRIPGVTVRVNGTNRGAITDTAGNFALHIASKSKAELGFSFLGYMNKDVTVPEGTSSVNVALPVNNNSVLSSVVIVGYGSKEKKSLLPPFPLIGDEGYNVYLQTKKKVEIPDLKVPSTGMVHVSFTVMPDGALQDFKVLQGMGKEADRAAVQNIKDGPKWMPASNKKKATVELKVPIELVKKGS